MMTGFKTEIPVSKSLAIGSCFADVCVKTSLTVLGRGDICAAGRYFPMN